MRDLEAPPRGGEGARPVEYFAGGHDWPPPDLAAEAIAWMEPKR
jgi:hypothetical protein